MKAAHWVPIQKPQTSAVDCRGGLIHSKSALHCFAGSRVPFVHRWSSEELSASISQRFSLCGSKSSLGKLKADPNEVLAGVEPAGFNHLPIVGGRATKAVELPPIHKDRN
jgi:hypothetical protein